MHHQGLDSGFSTGMHDGAVAQLLNGTLAHAEAEIARLESLLAAERRMSARHALQRDHHPRVNCITTLAWQSRA